MFDVRVTQGISAGSYCVNLIPKGGDTWKIRQWFRLGFILILIAHGCNRVF